MPEVKEHQVRQRTLTDEDVRILTDLLKCKPEGCLFSAEEVQFVRDWLDTAKTAKSEVVKWLVRGVFTVTGLVCGVIVAFKMGWFALGHK